MWRLLERILHSKDNESREHRWRQPIDWGKTRKDYSAWRPNYPDRFFEALAAFGVGLTGQRILDPGIGVGFLALRFAQQGCQVAGVDIAEAQILEARNRAQSLGLSADFRVAPAEATVAHLVVSDRCGYHKIKA